MTIVNNYFAIMFLFTLIFYIINFGCHESSCEPRTCNYSCGSNIICIKNGSVFIYNLHIHHWIIGVIVIFFYFRFLSNSIFTSIVCSFSSRYPYEIILLMSSSNIKLILWIISSLISCDSANALKVSFIR